jgi:hypothetical protein
VKQYSIKKALNLEIKRKDSHRGHRGGRFGGRLVMHGAFKLKIRPKNNDVPQNNSILHSSRLIQNHLCPKF